MPKCSQTLTSNWELRTGDMVMTKALILTALIWFCQTSQLRAIATRLCCTFTRVSRIAGKPSLFSCRIS